MMQPVQTLHNPEAAPCVEGAVHQFDALVCLLCGKHWYTVWKELDAVTKSLPN